MGLLQFCKSEQPQLESGYTLDDNARALIALIEYYAIQPDYSILKNIRIHFEFIERMQLESGRFINYLDYNGSPTPQNGAENLDDANGRAIWALGTLASNQQMFDPLYFKSTKLLLEKSLPMLSLIESPRAIAFAIKGLLGYYKTTKSKEMLDLISEMAQRLEFGYLAHQKDEHHWFEAKLTYANAVLPEALLLAAQATFNQKQQQIAQQSFTYLLKLLFEDQYFGVISNQTWYEPGMQKATNGQQPIDVAYTILALSSFYECTKLKTYLLQMKQAFDWYLGKNSLNQIVYNPVSGGCLDGIEAHGVNINQGAESTVTYLLARNKIESHLQQLTPILQINKYPTYQTLYHDSFRDLQTQKSTSA
jgi:uncharacterized protein YyaL (SSP411 family)